MDLSIVQQLKEAIANNENIGILIGKNYDLDSLAASLSLYLSLKSCGRKVDIASPKLATVEVSSLVGIDQLRNVLAIEGGDLTVSFPYNEGEIDKVSYSIDNGYLNIVVKAGETGLSFNKNDIKYTRGAAYPNLMFIVGTPRLSDLNELFDPEELKNVTLVNIDNKQDNQGFGEISFVSTQFSSVSEQMTKLILDLNLDLDQDIAQNLLSGISYATDNFQKQNTSIYAFEVTGILMRKGALRQKSYKKVDAISGVHKFRPQHLTRDDFFTPSSQQNRQNVKPPIAPPQGIPVQKAKDAFDKDQTPPPDWFTPKVYKGSSTNIG